MHEYTAEPRPDAEEEEEASGEYTAEPHAEPRSLADEVAIVGTPHRIKFTFEPRFSWPQEGKHFPTIGIDWHNTLERRSTVHRSTIEALKSGATKGIMVGVNYR